MLTVNCIPPHLHFYLCIIVLLAVDTLHLCNVYLWLYLLLPLGSLFLRWCLVGKYCNIWWRDFLTWHRVVFFVMRVCGVGILWPVMFEFLRCTWPPCMVAFNVVLVICRSVCRVLFSARFDISLWQINVFCVIQSDKTFDCSRSVDMCSETQRQPTICVYSWKLSKNTQYCWVLVSVRPL